MGEGPSSSSLPTTTTTTTTTHKWGRRRTGAEREAAQGETPRALSSFTPREKRKKKSREGQRTKHASYFQATFRGEKRGRGKGERRGGEGEEGKGRKPAFFSLRGLYLRSRGRSRRRRRRRHCRRTLDKDDGDDDDDDVGAEQAHLLLASPLACDACSVSFAALSLSGDETR